MPIYPITSLPGIQRDGTRFASRRYIDGQWCRFQRGLPRKMGGYKQIFGTLDRQPRGVYVVPVSGYFDVYIGDSNTLQFISIDQFGNNLFGSPVNITPTGFVPDPNNIWSFDGMFATVSNSSVIIAHAAPNLAYIGSPVETPVYYGRFESAAPPTPTGQYVSGGIAVFHPYLFMFGNDGEVIVSNINDPTSVYLTARVTAQKIVAGMASRGGNSSPAGLLWALDSVIRVTAVNTSAGLDFKFDRLSNQNSILSSRSIIEYDGMYFWAGVDRFLVYNGVIKEVPNQTNLNFFYYNNGTTGLNYQYSQKVWATKVPQYGEIWWFYPSGTSTECNRAVIYNVRENAWYDTAIERGAGYFEQVFTDPIWSDSFPDNSGKYRLWHHESGIDQNIDGTLTAIPSHFETGDISLAAVDPAGQWRGMDRWISIDRVEPDFVQTGDMSLTIKSRDYARATPQESGPYTFTPSTLKIDLHRQAREMTLKFESNEVGGFYELGQTLLDFEVSDRRASR